MASKCAKMLGEAKGNWKKERTALHPVRNGYGAVVRCGADTKGADPKGADDGYCASF